MGMPWDCRFSCPSWLRMLSLDWYQRIPVSFLTSFNFCIIFHLFQEHLRFIVFLFSLSGLLLLASMFSYPVRRHFNCLTMDLWFAFFVLVFLCITVCDQQIDRCISTSISRIYKESGRTLGVLMNLGRNDDLVHTTVSSTWWYPITFLVVCPFLQHFACIVCAYGFLFLVSHHSHTTYILRLLNEDGYIIHARTIQNVLQHFARESQATPCSSRVHDGYTYM